MRDATRTKEKILRTATETFAAKGYFGTRIDEIALGSNCNKRMIYAYFQSKEELYKQVLVSAFEAFADDELKVLLREENPVDQIELLLSFYFDYAASHSQYVRLLLWENLNNGTFIAQTDYGQKRRESFVLIHDIIERGQAMGVLKQNIDIMQFILSAIMLPFSYFSNHYTLNKLMDTDLYEAERLVQQKQHMIRLLMSSIR